MHACMHGCMNVRMQACTNVLMPVYIRMCIFVYICTLTHISMHIYIYVYKYLLFSDEGLSAWKLQHAPTLPCAVPLLPL